MAGLSAARYLMKAGIDVTVLEKNAYVGGRVHTDTADGFEFDTGAQFLTNFYTNTQQLIHELKLRDMVLPISGGTAISRSGRLYEISSVSHLLFTHLVSFRSKRTLTKLLWPILIHWRKLDNHSFHKAYMLDTRSISEYAHRALNDELLAYVLQPPLSGIFYWTPERTSQAMLFILLKANIGMKLFTLRHGLGRLPVAMAADLKVHCNAEVAGVARAMSGDYKVEASFYGQKRQFVADGVVCATPAITVSTLFPDLNTKQRAFFEAIHYSKSVAVAVGLKRRIPSNLYGLFCPDREIKYLGTVSLKSAKIPDQTPTENELIALFSSAQAGQELLNEEDEDILDKLWTDLKKTGLAYDPSNARLFYRVYRWHQALPEFDVGHFKRLKTFADGEIESGNVVFAGDYLGGAFIEGAVTSGLNAARRLLERFGSNCCSNGETTNI